MERAPIRKSLIRRITWLGGDRRLVGFSGLLLFLLCWTMFMGLGFMYGLSIVLPATLFAAIVWVARLANKGDSWMVDVVLRQFRYKKYYAPKADIGVEHPQIKDFT